jgi:hypothetical protein
VVAKRFESSCWPCANTFTAKTPLFCSHGSVCAFFSIQTSTSGGARETLEKAEAVMPAT